MSDDWKLGMPLDTPCGHAAPQAQDQLHGVCIFCWRDRAGALSKNVDAWGPGDKAGAKAFDSAQVGKNGERVDLFHGQFPHSRRDNNTYARDARGDVVGWSGHRAPVTIGVRELNYLKSSGASGDEWRRGCEAVVHIDGVHVYTLGAGREWLYALTRLPDVITRLLEHPVRLWDESEREELVGRRVWYRDQASVVDRWNAERGVFLVPDGTWFFSKPGWARVKDDGEEAWDDDYGRGLYADVLDAQITWFRDEGVR